MSSASNLLMAAAPGCTTISCAAEPLLRVCSDPNDMPYSNRQQKGFENRIALKDRLDAELVRRHMEIEEILRSYGIPQISMAAAPAVVAEK